MFAACYFGALVLQCTYFDLDWIAFLVFLFIVVLIVLRFVYNCLSGRWRAGDGR